MRHSHDGSASAEILSVGPMVISMNTHDARFPHFYARSAYEAKFMMMHGADAHVAAAAAAADD